MYLGHTIFNDEWKAISFQAFSAYSLEKRAFEIPVMPPAPLGTQISAGMAVNLLDAETLARMVNALLSKYDELQIGKLNWAYWHAVCAVPSMAAAHFGAAIEALQRAYVKNHPQAVNRRLVSDREVAKSLRQGMLAVLADAALDDEVRKILVNKVSNFNQSPWQVIAERFLNHIGIILGEAEAEALRHRNFAAHGNAGDDVDPLKTVRAFQLLRITFNRILLRITNAHDRYYDYCTYDHQTKHFPERDVRDPIPRDVSST